MVLCEHLVPKYRRKFGAPPRSTHVLAPSRMLTNHDLEEDPLPLVPPPEAERAGAGMLTADMLAAHVERVGIIDIEEALLLGVPGVALNPSMCTGGETEHASDSLPVGDRLRVEKQMRKMQAHASKAAEVRELVARVTAVKADGNECYRRGDLSDAVERYEAALALLQRPRETEGGSDEEDDLPSMPPREVASVATLRVDELVPEEFIEGLASLLRAGGEPSDVDKAKDLAVTCCINLAQCAARLERPADAVSACNVALELDERRGKAWFRRGQARAALGQHSEAIKDLSRAAVLLPDSQEVREALEQSTKAALPEVPKNGVVV